jgi:DNA-binding MarR family transcriptional regulator
VGGAVAPIRPGNEVVASADLTLGPLKKSVGLLIRLAQIGMFEAYFAGLSGREIRPGEFSVLAAINQNPGVRQGALADALKIKWSNMAKMIRSLEDRRLVRRQASSGDRRAIDLTLTSAGERLVEEMLPLVLANERRATPTLSETEYRTLHCLLLKMTGLDREVLDDSPQPARLAVRRARHA